MGFQSFGGYAYVDNISVSNSVNPPPSVASSGFSGSLVVIFLVSTVLFMRKKRIEI